VRALTIVVAAVTMVAVALALGEVYAWIGVQQAERSALIGSAFVVVPAALILVRAFTRLQVTEAAMAAVIASGISWLLVLSALRDVALPTAPGTTLIQVASGVSLVNVLAATLLVSASAMLCQSVILALSAQQSSEAHRGGA